VIVKKTDKNNNENYEESIDLNVMAKGITSGDRRLLSKAITLAESDLESHQSQTQSLLALLEPNITAAKTIAITGPPGAGKSTFIESMGQLAIDAGYRLAVLSVDPSSTFTAGSILGDKTRMSILASNEKVFIRPSPSRGTLGGVTDRSWEVKRLCEAAGYNLIFIETVGVGQSEAQVSHLVDMMTVLVQPGSGDDIQGIKKGLNEYADFFVINKADGSQLPLAKESKSNVAAMIHMKPKEERAGIALHSSQNKEMAVACWNAMLENYNKLLKNSLIATRRQNQNQYWFLQKIKQSMMKWSSKRIENNDNYAALEKEIQSGSLNISDGVSQFMKEFYTKYGK